MSQTRGRSTALIVALLVGGMLAAALFRWGGDGAETRPAIGGDIEEVVEGSDVDDLPERAAVLLATDRPWQAARLMRAYRERVGAMAPEHRVLAAQAEAGWGEWEAAGALLEGVPALDTYAGGIGLYLLGRARDAAGDPAGAVEVYRAFLALSSPAAEMEGERRGAALRLGLAMIRSGDVVAGTEHVREVARGAGDAAVWIDLLRIDALAELGDTAAVRLATVEHSAGLTGLAARRALVRAAEQAGDLMAARGAAEAGRRWASTATTQSEFLVRGGEIAIAAGDVDAGRAAMRAAIDLSPSGVYARQAANRLRSGDPSPEEALVIARVDAAQGLHAQAVNGFRRWLEAGQGSAAERAQVHIEHANALFYAQRFDEVAAALAPIASQNAARFLRARAAAHAGQIDEAMRIYLSLAEEFAGTPNGRSALFLAAGVRHDQNDFDRARELYQRVVERYPGSDYMGLAMMRLAGIAFLQEDYVEAVRLWDLYRARYPRGTRALESMYWAARAREEMGDRATAQLLYRQVRERERDGYYALRASGRLGEPFWPLPMSTSPGDDPAANARVAGWMAAVDLLRDAGFPDAAAAQADRVVAATGNDRATLYALAEALIERGYSRAAIRIGLRLQRTGLPNRRLLRILYPFPYRTLISEEARDRGLDPFVAAALIRQESMFEARITSPAGARGLMQIMPATGLEVAEAAGIESWNAEMLYYPEINVYLGTRYVAEQMAAYDNSLPSVFSAYNAGPHRVEWWSEFAEYGHEELFTERIPYRETRDYVKILTRNRALYAGLYGEE